MSEQHNAAYPPGEPPDWKLVASRIWGMVLHRLTPQQVNALSRIAHAHPTTRELARYLEITEQQAGNVTRTLYREGFLRREKAGRSNRWFPAFPAPSPFHYYDSLPLRINDPEAIARVEEIVERRRD